MNWRDEYTFAWEGEHVTVYGYERAEAEVCGGSFEALDQNSAAIIDLLRYDDSLHYDYYWMSQDVWDGRCPPGAIACTSLGVPWTRSIPHMHEAAHALSYLTPGHGCTSVLEEGLAEYFGGPRFHADWNHWSSPEFEGTISEFLTAVKLPGRGYERAGHFASFLVEAYGPEAVASLCRTIPHFSTEEDWQDATQAILGVELEHLLEEYGQYPLCHHQQYRARLWECAGEPDAVADPHGEVVFEVSMDCHDPGTIGPLAGRIVATRRIWFPEDMRAGVFVVGEDGEAANLDFNLEECAPCSAYPDLFANTDLTTVFNFRAGMYELILYSEPEESESLVIRLVPF
ncbi:hypothetical protein [Enhygromyxa salina]|uniref:hypothetical protein n=1 Tax=Enhygromyxa salina TaxID=215803 RepID=UPI0011B1DB0D|nr:hypothetical protein [Enhygromyxa salina]